MELYELRRILRDQWKKKIAIACQPLERDDLRQVSVLNTWDDLLGQIAKGRGNQPAGQEFAMLTPSLLKLQTFTDVYMSQFVDLDDTRVFWGMIRLTIKLAQEYEATSNRIPRLIREICHRVEVLNRHCGGSQSLTPELQEQCLETGVALLQFFGGAVNFMRSDVEYTTAGNQLDNEWQPLAAVFTSTVTAIDESLARLKRLSKLSAGVQSEGVNNSSVSLPILAKQASADEVARLPCLMLPSMRISRFFDRLDVIEKIEEYFKQVDPSEVFRSLAIHGLGGVGKSSVALRYAEAKLRRNELDALFWVHSEKLISISQSFSDIALRLRLPDARTGDHQENQALVMDWLQTTHARWLIIYDNAEDIDLIRSFWPAASRGQALITTRNHSFAFDLADSGLELTTWDASTGSQFLLHLLSTDIGDEIRDDEVASAQELAHKLSGHALAISHMAGLIHRRAWTIAEFMKIYNEHPSEMHGISGNTSIDALWDFAFKSLDSKSRAILGVMSYVEPDSIPQSLFETAPTQSLPESLQFCSDHLRFSEAIENLLTLALIKRDKKSRTFSLHRLVQTSFKFSMTAEQRQQSFNDAATMVSYAFPHRDTKVAQLYHLWERCGQYVQHVSALKDCFRQEVQRNAVFSVPQTYCNLNNQCQRYLLEISAYTELGDLIEANQMALATLPLDQQAIGLQGSLTSHKGQLLCRLGNPKEGVEWLQRSYDIRSRDVPFNSRESAWAASNAANGFATLGDLQASIKWHSMARDHWLDWARSQDLDQHEWSATLKIDMADAQIWSNDIDSARLLLTEALAQIESEEPYNWAMAAYTYYALGNIDRKTRQYEAAESHFMEAQNAWVKGDQLRSAPFSASCMYRLGCVALDRGKSEAAIKHLRDAKAVTEMRKGLMIAEHARVLHKLSEALAKNPRGREEARELRKAAEMLACERQPGFSLPAVESSFDAMVFVLWR